MGSQTTNVGGMSPDELQGILKQAQSDRAGKFYMEAGAGQTMAKLVMASRDEVDEALDKAKAFKKATGFGEADSLNSGIHAVEHYARQVHALQQRLQELRDKLSGDIDHFIAMDHIYTNVDKLSAENLMQLTKDVQITVSS